MIQLAYLSQILLLLTLGLTALGAYVCFSQITVKSTNSAKSVKLNQFAEAINSSITYIYIFVSLVLLYAFYACEFSYQYVYGYSDSTLPLFYRLTAFWGGQPGSLLFWALSVLVCGLIFQNTKSYKSLSPETRSWYLLFLFIAIAFFSALLTTYNDPFELFPSNRIPFEGAGLNPLLQHPGMIFHPPLLLLGYGGFTIPACLALAQAMSHSVAGASTGGTIKNKIASEIPWHKATMVMTLCAWLLLSAGIILGAWWAYMELGWGGYWAWDPVENASLIPWFFATAAIHLGFLNAYRNKATRSHTLLMGLTYSSAIFATWLVRGNVVASVHAFGGSGIGTILGMYTLLTTIGMIGVTLCMPKKDTPLGGPETREGLAVSTVVLLLTISVIIMIATLWPVISTLPSVIMGKTDGVPVGIGVEFYNRIILPLLTVILALLMVCPWVSWTGKIAQKKYFCTVLLFFVITMVCSWIFFDIKIPLALLGVTVSVTCMFSWLLFAYEQKGNKLSPVFVHVGFAMMGLGVAVSGPYQIEQDLAIKRGETISIGGFDVRLNEVYFVPTYQDATLVISRGGQSDTITLLRNQPIKLGDYRVEIGEILDNRQSHQGRDIDLIVTVPTEKLPQNMIHIENEDNIENTFVAHLNMGTPASLEEFTITATDKTLNRFSFYEAELNVSINGKEHGLLQPQRRRYATHPNNVYSEAVTIASLGKEIYATFSGMDNQERAHVRILIQPLVNWIWIGGVIMSIAPFFNIFGMSNRARRKENEEGDI